MFSTDFIFRQQENLVDNQKCQAGFRPLCNKILFQTWKTNLTDWANAHCNGDVQYVLIPKLKVSQALGRNFQSAKRLR